MTSIQTDTIIQQWINEGIKLSSPATAHSIKATEEIIDFQFPDDFKIFYLKLNGFADWKRVWSVI
ncbi:cell wall assembly/cell proliferation coordinating protein [Chryseobacterium sp. StRB126]|uniref:SMI1/KNR4 family protein n=1 Tax=Chryseobacterium sp. StRB126 TaxID=878220 RepID=UPI0004E99DD6|nr:SMI1/KNR4 family protein [Chryseobacterium sp. StRB126]BAP33386.1 cell wall assembly/cell proliferation coordinating protein [Chryseobacterium sp. StRB126]